MSIGHVHLPFPEGSRAPRRFASLMAAVFLASFASPTTAPGPEAMRGCWIERQPGKTITMRWFPDRSRPGVWSGETIHYFEGGAQGSRREVRLEAGAWRYVWMAEDGLTPRRSAPIRWGGAPRRRGEVGIAAGADRLTILERLPTGFDAIEIEARRDGCD